MEQETTQGKQAIDRLVGLGHMRVWSVIITIFGDAVVERGGVVASSTLAALTEPMGVKPEAFRVALSRLTKDGWISRSKKGRLSFYRLSDRGTAEFAPATARIYAPAPGSATGWRLVLMPAAATDALPKGAVGLGGRAYLVGPDREKGGSAGPLHHEGFCVTGSFDRVPDWVRDKVGPEELALAYDRLCAELRGLSLGDLTDLEAAVVRVLVVHQWRRLVLRHADLPPRFFPEDWSGETCRQLVQDLRGRLAERSDRWFDNQIS